MTEKPKPPPEKPTMAWGEMLSRHLQTDPSEVEPPPGRAAKIARPKPMLPKKKRGGG
jgi:hypothetical protein